MKLATLLKVQPSGFPRPPAFYYQNYRQSTPIVYPDRINRLWVWAPFEVKNLPQNDLALSDENTQILIARSKELDAQLALYDDFRRAFVTILPVRMDRSDPVEAITRQVSYATRDGAAISFTLGSDTSALQGPVTSKYTQVDPFRELPIYKVR